MSIEESYFHTIQNNGLPHHLMIAHIVWAELSCSILNR